MSSSITNPPSLRESAVLASLPVEHVADMSVELEAPQVFRTAIGTRMTYVTKGGQLLGPRLRGELLPGGGDWVLTDSNGVSHLDVRGTIRTDDGVLIHYAAGGVSRLPSGGRATLADGGRIPFGESYIRTTPRFETSDERYSWLSAGVHVAVNELSAGHIMYRIFRLL
ncbi:DUF3237 domain-containing protein [Rhodococcus globerulus]|uniref:DUF3237 domain-containing protein n=1 Tax=Rhodococcus globerulus TaxID=33008 RepID=UPI000A3F12ED|nr:DUF3237 domain-containing protein [Rhodococcus globerulus]